MLTGHVESDASPSFTRGEFDVLVAPEPRSRLALSMLATWALPGFDMWPSVDAALAEPRADR